MFGAPPLSANARDIPAIAADANIADDSSVKPAAIEESKMYCMGLSSDVTAGTGLSGKTKVAKVGNPLELVSIPGKRCHTRTISRA
jgi:hypothetical protein